jgi:mannitol/fructose-specific phosphotransferase system IIA component (Ntr-type)
VLISPFIPLNWHIVAALLCVVFVLINLKGTKEAAGLQVVLVLALLGLMVSFIVTGFSHINLQHFEPFAPYGIKSVISTTGFVFVSYGGLVQVASIAGEVKNPGRTIPQGMIVSIIVMVIFYTLMIFVTSGVLETEQLDNSLTPISDAAGSFLGKPGYFLISIAAALAFVTTANAGIMTASRYLLAIGKDELLPPVIAKISSKHQTPYIAVFVTAVLIIIAVFLNLNILVEAASTVFVLSYVLASISVIVLRESGIHNYRPAFYAPFYPWLQWFTVVAFAFVLFEMGEDAFFVTAVIILAGFSVYWFYGRKKVEKDSALLHLVNKITAKELVTGTLENELKEIIRERDEIVQDKIDNIVESSIVIDIEESIDQGRFFEIVAEKLSQKLNVDSNELQKSLKERELESSTVLSDKLAVPHIIIKGENKFEMVLARCRKGIYFSKNAPHITTVFVLAGTKDLRNLHLRVLSAIAHVVQVHGFEKQWLKAKNKQALKDTVLLSKRSRIE